MMLYCAMLLNNNNDFQMNHRRTREIASGGAATGDELKLELVVVTRRTRLLILITACDKMGV